MIIIFQNRLHLG